MKADVVIIGAGIVGASLARKLSLYNIRVLLIDASSDVATGSTKANTALVHAGYDAVSHTLMARFNREGHAMYKDLCCQLDVPYKQIGSLVIAFNNVDEKQLQKLLDRGKTNGIKDLHLIDRNEVLNLEPAVNSSVRSALYAPKAAITGPWELAIALTENAMDNGTELSLISPVTKIEKKLKGFVVTFGHSSVTTRAIVNCAGIESDTIHAMLKKPDYTIIPRKGTYFLLDKKSGDHVKHIIFQTPSELGKGVVCAPTVHGNLIIGPDACQNNDKYDLSVTRDSMDTVRSVALQSFPDLDFGMSITEFAGVRAHSSSGDFVIRHVTGIPGFFEAGGIKSPGLTAAPAIAEFLSDQIIQYLGAPSLKLHVKTTRKPVIRFSGLSDAEKGMLIKANPAWGHIVCRCETVTEAEIVDSIHRFCGSKTVDGVKRRVRPGSGRCQGGFCLPKVIQILARELKIPPESVEKELPGSWILKKGGSV